MEYKRTEAPRERWMEVAKACPYATYFHTPYWYDIIAPGGRHIALEVSFEDGASAIIPVAKIRRFKGLLTDHFSSPGGNYGGWISTSVLNKEHVRALTGILTSKKNLTFRINPFDGSQASLITLSMPVPSPSVSLIGDFTYTVDLTKGIAKLHSELSGGHRRAVNSALRNGIVVTSAQAFEDWERYYGIYADTLARWRKRELKTRNVYPLSFFRRICENRTGNEILWLAMKDGLPIAGILMFYWGRHAVAWHGAALTRYFDLRPNNLLCWEIIKDAAEKGYEVFDFNPSGGYGGVESFKSHFGAVRVPSPVLVSRTRLRSLISRLRSGSPGRSSSS